MSAAATPKTAKKSAPATGARKLAKPVAAKPKAAASKTVNKLAAKKTSATTKTVARKPAATKSAAAAAKKTETKKVPAKTAVKSVTVKKPAPTPAKAPAKNAAKAVASTKSASAADTTVGGKATKSAAGANSKSIKSEVRMSNDNAANDTIDTMKRNAVSKVSTVATKTTKSTSALPTDGALLTEAQILSMSEKDYMNPAQLAFFKARLQQLERDLLKNAGETTEHLRETVLVPDPADRATIEEEHALELRTRDRERKLLKKVQQSIASIDAGDYGWCEETGEPIGVPRLLARPTATLSLEAQQRRELKQKMYGD